MIVGSGDVLTVSTAELNSVFQDDETPVYRYDDAEVRTENERLKAIIRRLLDALPDTRQLLLAREDAKAALMEQKPAA